jgi:hypothetical protein
MIEDCLQERTSCVIFASALKEPNVMKPFSAAGNGVTGGGADTGV